PQDNSDLELISTLGLTFLLFIVGLKLDITSLKTMGNAFLMGTFKIFLILGIGFTISKAMGMTAAESVFVGMGLAFSSTIVIVKILSDKGEIDSLPGRVALGTLIVEDIAAVIAMIIINIVSGNNDPIGQILIKMGKNIAILFLIVFVIGKYILPYFLKFWAKNHELLMVISIFFAIGFAVLCDSFGFSAEVGAFIAGMMFAPYKEFRGIIASKLASIRDVTLIFFFVNFGFTLQFNDVEHLLPKILLFTFFAIFLKPIFAYVLMNYMKYKKNTALKTGLFLSQISEFSLIISTVGINKKLIGSEILTIMGCVLILSVFISSFLINYADPITNLLTAKFKFKDNKWQKEKSFENQNSVPTSDYTNIILGMNAFGSTLYDYMVIHNKPILGIDFDPLNVAAQRQEGKNVIYGDIHDINFLNSLNFRKVKWIINTIPEADHQRFLMTVKKLGFSGNYSAKADIETNTTREDLEKAGVDLIFEPFINAAREAFYMIIDQEQKLKKEKMKKDIALLKDHYIICGYGRMGKQIATDFLNEGVNFVIVENNPEHREELSEGDFFNIIGNAADDKVLKEAGIEHAKGLIAVYPTDEQNVFIVLSAKSLNPDLDIVARSILEENKTKLKNAGANKVISPYIFGGRKIASAVLRPTVFEFNEKTYHGNDYDIVFEELETTENCSFIGKTIAESDFRKNYGVTIVAIKRQNGEFISNPNYDIKFEKGDIIIIIAGLQDIENLNKSTDFSLRHFKTLE
ncbi:MAG: NAD-binding protein, partial [Armatimonadetes bacterium]|nr:NAD-binding protein [Candidatus Hippobium faecium]